MFAYQLTNEGNGPSLAEIWHAVNAKRCVPPVHNNRMWKCIDQFLNKEHPEYSIPSVHGLSRLQIFP